MASEITYAEVKFKNASPAAVAEAPPEKKNEHHPQKYPLCLPWLISLLLFLVCIALIIVFLVESWTCCPKGWRRFQEKCYYLSNDLMSWAESEQNCTGMGSHLVVINSKAEQDFLFEELRKSSKIGVNYYIGLHAQVVGQWHWLDGTPLSETAAFWRAGEPSNVDHEMCVVIHTKEVSHNNWNDVICKDHNRICQAEAVTV
ncbi:C-type lectin domain family 4 member A isoform X2 [Calypte anna]|uniref:C-type lectin domain family 4 member A isoform X2 n=1 Tax=Calypte anna TaxID=9244 RepID=UPI0011C3845D|nr:C-type lectin domain family 4 member A isoform X2 [Calypte anna]